jgi:AraC-like DNA-binding protein
VVFHGLRLQPWSIPFLFHATADELRDAVIPIDALLPQSLARGVAESVWNGEIPRGWTTIDTSPWQVRLVQRLLDAPGQTIEEIGRDGGVSARHARRSTRMLTGLSPGELARVGRLQRLLPGLDRGEQGLAGLAAEVGYADHAHLSRDVKRLTGATPSDLRDERSRGRPAGPQRVVLGTADLET